MLWLGLSCRGHFFFDRSAPGRASKVYMGQLKCGHCCGLQLLEWWYLSGEERLAANQKQTPPPPPPAPPLPHPEGVALPSDPSICPLCLTKRTNPAMAVVSGYVFCYPCLFNYVGRVGCCPVTRNPMTVAQMRRLYQSA